MPITFAGEFQVPRKPEEAYDFLTDPNKFGPLLPEFLGLSVEDPAHFTVKVRVGISHIKGTAEVKMHLAETQRPRRAVYQCKGTVAGGTVEVKAGFDMEAHRDGSDGNMARHGHREVSNLRAYDSFPGNPKDAGQRIQPDGDRLGFGVRHLAMVQAERES